jgi:hypothetical protein
MGNTRKPAAPATASPFESAWALWAVLASNLAQAQRMQLEAALAWQQPLAAIGQELWDEWAVRFAGGAPIE